MIRTTDKWSFIARLPQPINHAMTAVVDGRLYVIGGQLTAGGRGRAAGYVNTNLVYDVGNDRWLGRARMPTSRSAGMAAVLDGKIYVAGGRPPRGSDFAVYDPRTDSWETLPGLPTQRNHMVAVALDGKIFVAGGREGGGFRSPQIGAVEAFDPKTGKWEQMAPLPEPRSGLNGIVHKGCLHVFGGEGLEGTNQDGVHTEHDVYNPKTGKWTQLPPIPVPIHGVVGMASFGDWMHLPGGGIRQGGSSGTTLHQVVKTDISLRMKFRDYSAASAGSARGQARPSCSQVGPTSLTVARCASRGQRPSSNGRPRWRVHLLSQTTRSWGRQRWA